MTTISAGDKSLSATPPLTASVPPQRPANEVSSSNSVVTTSVTKEGYLQKRGDFNRAWKIRWFSMVDNKLYYYKSFEQKKAINFIPLDQSVVRVCTDKREKNHCFEIVTKHRVFLLSAKSNKEMLDWVKAISMPTILLSENELINQAEEMIIKSTLDAYVEELKKNEAFDFFKIFQAPLSSDSCSNVESLLASMISLDSLVLANEFSEDKLEDQKRSSLENSTAKNFDIVEQLVPSVLKENTNNDASKMNSSERNTSSILSPNLSSSKTPNEEIYSA